MLLNYFELQEKQYISDDADINMNEKVLFFQRNQALKNEHLETKLMRKLRTSYQSSLYYIKVSDQYVYHLDYLMNIESL
jgi:hypothetical protein